MYKVKPISYSTLWGDDRLKQYGANIEAPIGIVYSVSGIEAFNCEIENEQEHTTLKEKVEQNPECFGLLKGEEFPVIIAFDACKESVSFQIHPRDDYAKQKLNLPYGKSEAWFFIQAPTHHFVWAKHNGNIKNALETNTMEDIINHLPVKEHDLVYLQSGVVHALTKGSLIYEIQQSTNITYRLYDYNRIDPKTNKPRQLNIDEALDNIDSNINPVCISFEEGKQDFREFSLHHTTLKQTFTNESNIVCAISVLKNKAIINHETITQGHSILVLPKETITIQNEADVMIAYISDYFRHS
ncbi:class I mannose-6-phosphate isomerase [Floccifex sp.]|uniref:class I mannose-6-phosphate isomerase n=1 Tax=Floccifex sp. TaxID=2815810 RepID=UPI002A74D29B|nr:mannose-6-phosphate isomerase [Floccifex sp.]MDD7281594.1 mannose-6-phosphate isomerase [Erysipelotrichaceae bacterium]MDY2957482.1 mannose-6-phosphate isomerase [Floccifex sp.]